MLPSGYALEEPAAPLQRLRPEASECGTFAEEPYLVNGEKVWKVADSEVDGQGVILTAPVPEGVAIDVAITGEWPFMEVTEEFGRWVNHCKHSANVVLQCGLHGGDWWVVALRDLAAGEEITADYDVQPWFVQDAPPSFVDC